MAGAITRDARFFDIIEADIEKVFVVGMLWFGYPKLTPTQSRAHVDDVTTTLP